MQLIGLVFEKAVFFFLKNVNVSLEMPTQG